MIRQYFQNIATLCSQTAHTLFVSPRHPANPDITISSRAHIEAEVYGNRIWTRTRNVIDWIFRVFFRDKDHCRGSFARDERNSVMFQEYARGIMKNQN